MITTRRLVALALVLLLTAAAATVAGAQPAAPATPVALTTNVLADVLAMVGPAPAPAPAQPLLQPGAMISFMGDSITNMGGYVRLAGYVLNTNYPDLKPTIINVGIGGQVAENMEPRFVKDMRLAEKPAFCFISVGINDVWHRDRAPEDPAVLEAYKGNVAKMVDEAQAAGATAVLLTPTLISEDVKAEDNRRLVAYVDAEKQIATDKKAVLVDLHGMFLAAEAVKPKGLALTRDGVHMNAYGDGIMALGVLRALGVPDATFAKTDALPTLALRDMGPLSQLCPLLQTQPVRFVQFPFASFLAF